MIIAATREEKNNHISSEISWKINMRTFNVSFWQMRFTENALNVCVAVLQGNRLLRNRFEVEVSLDIVGSIMVMRACGK